MVSPVNSWSLKKSQVPDFTLTDAIWFCQPLSLRCACSSLAPALVPPKFGSEKIAISQPPPCAGGGGATNATVRGGGGAPGLRQYCTHCQSPSPSSKATRCQFRRQPSSAKPSQQF